MIICGIETSCDETSVAIVRNGDDVLSNIVYSQIEVHKKYGGVVPEIASRKHIEKINHVFIEAMEKTDIDIDQIDRYAVTYGPGLVGALLVGVSFAKAIAYSQNKTLIPVNHMHAHIYANFLQHNSLQGPFICLVVSGGHTHIVDFKAHERIEVIGKTRDDAVGEAFDKVARAMGIGYPGGPIIDKMSIKGNPLAYKFPRASFSDNKYDFSFSGPKTAVLNTLNSAQQKGETYNIEDICASFQKSICDLLVEKSIMACMEKGYKKICLAGGVAANRYLRKYIVSESKKNGIDVFYPDIGYCTDNAAMVAARAFYSKISEKSFLYLNAVPNLKIDSND